MRVTVGETVRVEQPSQEIRNWANKTLILPNPDYDKKAAMGFWTGNTPQTLTLFEKLGDTWEFPFGTLRSILRFCGKADSRFKPPKPVEYGGIPVPLYDYQEDAVEAMVRAKFGILQSAAGSGKTQMGIALVKRWGVTALWLTHTQDLLRQSMDRAGLYMDPKTFGTITAGKVNIGTGITFATVQTMSKLDLARYRDLWDVVIVDECFPGYTPIETKNGPKPIGEAHEGDLVLTVGEDGKTVFRPVTHVFRRKPHSLMTIGLENGLSLTCTTNHPILTQRGYVKAGEINRTDRVCVLWESIRSDDSEQDATGLHKARRTIATLLERMRKSRRVKASDLDAGAQETVVRSLGGDKSKVRFGENESSQSDGQRRCQGESLRKIERDETQTSGAGRKRQRGHRTTADSEKRVGANGNGACDGVHRCDASAKRRLSDALQNRHRHSGRDDRRRGGRRFSHEPEGSGGRQEEGRLLDWVGVESLQVFKPCRDGEFGSLCPDGYVYNLEVEENHNYFANGINVHNCHHASGSPTTVTMYYKVLNNLRARHKYGLSATVHRADGLVPATHALLGETMWKVPDEAVANRVMKAEVKPVYTGTPLSDECLRADGTLDFPGMITYLTEDEERNNLILEAIEEEEGHSCLILSDRIDHLDRLYCGLPPGMRQKAVMVTGKMVSKAGKAEREAALDQMRSGEKRYLFASYALAKEGLDIPQLDRLFMATPVKDEAVVIQAVGRVCRTAEGKDTPLVYDFVDNIRYCQRAYRERTRHYRKIGAKVI